MQSQPAAGDGGSPRRTDRSRPTLSRTQLLFWMLAGASLLAGAVLLLTSPGHEHRRASGVAPNAAPRAGEALTRAGSPLPACGVSCDPIDRRYLTDVPFGATSFWVQPWRAYMDTWPASRLLGSLGVNFNVGPAQAPAVARLLHDSGFRLARLEIPWGGISYANPTTFIHEASIRARLRALHAYGLRPLIVLNGNSAGPAPARPVTIETNSPAPAGASTVTLSPAGAAAVIVGRSGFDPGNFHTIRRARLPVAPRNRPNVTPAQRQALLARLRAARRAQVSSGLTPLVLQGRPDILITRVGPGGVATLSRPLPTALPAGAHEGTTLLYAPFGPPKLPDGSPNPAFEATLRGWLSYVSTVARTAQSVFGAGGYDLEVWNELSFGSQFLNAQSYSSTGPGKASLKAINSITKEVVKALLDRTVAFLRDPANGISPAVGISNGFASQSPFPSGASAPLGLTAISKHPYVGPKIFPAELRKGRVHPVNALGALDTASKRSFTPLFIPTYQSLMPEYMLTATSAETLIRDLAPITTNVYRLPHGRDVGPPGGRPVEKWVTEYNLSPGKATVVAPDGVTPQTGSSSVLTPADKAHFHAKALLRNQVAMVNKGAAREYFFAASPSALGMISEGFLSAVKAHPGTYPGDSAGGETMSAFRNLLARFQGPGPNGAARRLELLSIAQDGNHAQFAGDGTSAHPPLYDRDVLAVLPFQSSPTHFVIPVYVMTRDMLTLYRPSAPAGDATRFDLPDERFRITLGNLPASGAAPAVSAYDPLRDRSTPARILSRAGNLAVIELAATDYPRLLSIGYR
jgi:hypothetical protein